MLRVFFEEERLGNRDFGRIDGDVGLVFERSFGIDEARGWIATQDETLLSIGTAEPYPISFPGRAPWDLLVEGECLSMTPALRQVGREPFTDGFERRVHRLFAAFNIAIDPLCLFAELIAIGVS